MKQLGSTDGDCETPTQGRKHDSSGLSSMIGKVDIFQEVRSKANCGGSCRPFLRREPLECC